jgi:hypothetical protein
MSMSDCLHCDINDLVQQHIERAGVETVDVAEIAAKMTESLADLILSAVPETEQARFLAQTIAYLGEAILQKSEEGASDTTH